MNFLGIESARDFSVASKKNLGLLNFASMLI